MYVRKRTNAKVQWVYSHPPAVFPYFRHPECWTMLYGINVQLKWALQVPFLKVVEVRLNVPVQSAGTYGALPL
jgi:hypothetical protein